MLAKLYSLVVFKSDMWTSRAYFASMTEQPLTQEAKDVLRQRLEGWARDFIEAEFAASKATCDHLLAEINDLTTGKLVKRLDQLAENFSYDAKNHLALTLSPAKGSFYGSGFSSELDQVFPSAKHEVHEARKCYAVDRHTACVFHMMRAAEYALRTVVRAVGVTAPTVPLEFQEWQNLIEQLESRVGPVDKWPQPARANGRAFFNRLISDFYAFKDDIRNVTMHTRAGGTYDEPGALSVMNRVKECFERIATKADENSATNLLDPALFA